MHKLIKSYFDNLKYDSRTSMCDLFQKNKSDKSTWHNYTTFYDCIFSKYIGKNINFFELGLGTNNLDVPSNMGSNGKPGASLYAFKEYFKNANIYGADIDKRILFQDDGIETYYVDQTNLDEVETLWSNFKNLKFDIMIDDGLHEYSANITFFENSIRMLNDGGIYIIEDVTNDDFNKFTEYYLTKNFKYSNVLKIPYTQKWGNTYFNGTINNWDNNLVIVVK